MKTGSRTFPAGPAAGRRVPAATAIAVDRRHTDFDAAKVARVAQAIRDGRFVVDAGRIADRLIVNAESLLGRRLAGGPAATAPAACESAIADARSNLETT